MLRRLISYFIKHKHCPEHAVLTDGLKEITESASESMKTLTNLTNRLIESEYEIREARKQLALSERAFKQLTTLINYWVWQTDSEGRYIWVSDKTRELYGFDAKDLIGHRPSEFVSEAYRKDAIDMETQILAQKMPLINYPTESIMANGRRIKILLSCIPIYDDEGIYRGHLGVERKAEQ